GVAAKAPLKDPTAVRAALTITISPGIGVASWTLTARHARRELFCYSSTGGTRLRAAGPALVLQWLQFFASQIATVFAATLSLYPYTDANGRVGPHGPIEVCPRQNPCRDQDKPA
ncbi:MAG: hypothetical protein ACRECP_07200, partial [Methylocella sp.]